MSDYKMWRESKGSKMRNKPVWECPGCGSTSAPCHTPKKRAKCLSCGQTMIYHQSQKEFKRWKELKQIEKAGHIRGLERQKKFKFYIQDYHAKPDFVRTTTGRPLTYTADFVYEEWRADDMPEAMGLERWHLVVEDTKGAKKGAAFDLFHLKRELMRLCRGITVKVT